METALITPKKRKLSQKNSKMSHKNPIQSDKIPESVEKLFTKRYEILNPKNYSLPPPKTMFITPPWSIPSLQSLKNDLNATKSRLNDFNLMEWQNHTRRRNPAGEVQWRLRRDIDPEFLTQAWCKFYENISTFPLIPQRTLETKKLNSIHLCEAPGAFITSLNHYLKTNLPEIVWKWTSTTLNPHYEGNSLSTMISDDRFILHTSDNWFFGSDNTGDLMSLKNLDELIERGRENGEIMLVTADGSINCLDKPDEQESVVVHLHYCEAVAAIHLLEKGGNFLLKVFTIFEHQTICLIYLLSCCFERIVFNKPATSREGNSEVYVICLGFRGREIVGEHLVVLREFYEEASEAAMFRREDIPEEFVLEILRAGEFFKAIQCDVIEGNVKSFGMGVGEEVRRVRKAVGERFIEGYAVRGIEEEMEIVGKRLLGVFRCEVMGSKFSEESFNDRRRKDELQGRERMRSLREMMVGLNDGGEVVFNLQNNPGPLKITLGKPFEKIQSSRFCVAKILKYFNSGFDVMNQLQLKIEFPETKIKSRFIEEMERENKKVYCFDYTPNIDKNLIKKLTEILEKVEENETIILLGYSLLTQLNVGILYLMAHAFTTLEMKLMKNFGIIVTLKNARNTKRILQIFQEINEASEKARENDKLVISIFPIVRLCASEMYQSTLMMNHGMIKHIINYMTEIIETCSRI